MSVTMTSRVTPALAWGLGTETLYTKHLYSGNIQYGGDSYGNNMKFILQSIAHCDAGQFQLILHLH